MTLEEILEPCLIHVAALKTFDPVHGAPTGRTRKFITQREQSSIRRDIDSGNYSLNQIAQRHDRTPPTIRHYVQPGDVLPKGYVRKIPLKSIPTIIKQHHAGLTLVEIGKIHDISPASVSAIINKNKVET